jgi:hypothetical protein
VREFEQFMTFWQLGFRRCWREPPGGGMLLRRETPSRRERASLVPSALILHSRGAESDHARCAMASLPTGSGNAFGGNLVDA